MSTQTLQQILPLYIFRVLHIGSLIGISYKTVHDYLGGTLSLDNASFFAWMAVVVMASGNTAL